MGIRFDRRVSTALLEQLGDGGCFAGLVGLVDEWGDRADLQLRKNRAAGCHASFYMGLTSILDIHELDGKLALRAHRTHRLAGGFDPAWGKFAEPADWVARWPGVETYLRSLAANGKIDARWLNREGVVQAAVSAGAHESYGSIQAQAVVWSDDDSSVKEMVASISDQLWAAIGLSGRTDGWWPGIRDRGARPGMGDETDVLAVDPDGRLLCIEVKPSGALPGITWGPAQVALYAELFARWVDTDSAVASSAVAEMAAQRAKLGLLDNRWSQVSLSGQVVPVLAIGAGRRSPDALARLDHVAAALSSFVTHPRVGPLEVWLLDEAGDPVTVWRPGSGEPVPSGRGEPVESLLSDPDVDEIPEEPEPVLIAGRHPSKFKDSARRAALAWKKSTPLLPDEARKPGRYGDIPGLLDVVLPDEYRALNLLPEAREFAMSRFASAGIVWHGDGHGPNPHLLSSQVQCLNALAPLVDCPDELARLLRSGGLDVSRVLPFGTAVYSPFEESDHVVFEWQGLVDHLNEWHDEPPTRGAMATSIDAAIRYETSSGSAELALIEWKYTESYPNGGRLKGSAARHQHRLDRYRAAFNDPDSPMFLPGGVDYDDMFAEPVYQLMRMQLLAWRMEQVQELDARRVVVVYAAPGANAPLLEESLGSVRFEAWARSHGGLIPGWRAMLRRPDRFASIDTTALVTTDGIVAEDFGERYAHMASHNCTPQTDVAAPPPGAAAHMTGDEVREAIFEGDEADLWVGRQGGLDGRALTTDLQEGTWATHRYQVARGVAAPKSNWFSATEFLDRVRDHRDETRRQAGWDTVGAVVIDSGSVAVAVPSGARTIETSELFDDIDGMVVVLTMADLDIPVETRTVDGSVVEVRVDVDEDMDEYDPAWQVRQTFDVGEDGLVVFDPRKSVDTAVPVAIPAGRWRVSVCDDAGGIGIRLDQP